MFSPTKNGIRVDAMGDGHYGSSRDGGTRIHKGVDFIAKAGQDVFAPFNMVVERVARPYAKHPEYEGIAWRTKTMTGKMFYFKPLTSIIGKEVKQGDKIGVAQDLQLLYGSKMTNHIHFQIDSIDPMTIDI